mmetsp:Transcript_16124/g.38706  ORF Transcript_16124/g.38706 Transcript_16124/m.38706 type:complete len:101 (+) Transcript_16124:1988-2290(+)
MEIMQASAFTSNYMCSLHSFTVHHFMYIILCTFPRGSTNPMLCVQNSVRKCKPAARVILCFLSVSATWTPTKWIKKQSERAHMWLRTVRDRFLHYTGRAQ